MVKPAGRKKNVKTLKPTGPTIDASGKMVNRAGGGKTLKRTAPKIDTNPKMDTAVCDKMVKSENGKTGRGAKNW